MRTLRSATVLGATALLVVAGTAVYLLTGGSLLSSSRGRSEAVSRPRVVINEAARTLVYLPLYHAQRKGYFTKVDLQVVTGGTATNSFAAMLSGEAQLAQADPMYVPISRQQGSDAVVVGQVVGRVAVWGVSFDPSIRALSASSLRGKRISTHVQPMTAYTYTSLLLNQLGLEPDRNVTIVQNRPGSELAPALNNAADVVMTVEPAVSLGEEQGGRVVYSFATALGDRVFSALMTTQRYLRANRQTVLHVVTGYQRALDDLHAYPDSALATARAFFPQVAEGALRRAVVRLLADSVVPTSVTISERSWDAAVGARIAAGDLRQRSSREQSCDLALMSEAHSGRRQ